MYVVVLLILPVSLHGVALHAQSSSPGDTAGGDHGDTRVPTVTAPAGAPGSAVSANNGAPLVADDRVDPVGPPRAAILAATGTRTYALIAEESDDIHEAIEHAIAHMNFIIRPIARRRLTRANRVSPLITFAVSPDTLAVTFTGLNPVVTPIDGDTVPWRRGSTGETYTVHIEQAGDTLRQIIATDDGLRENDFVFLEGGAAVEMHVTLLANRLPAPLRYVELFREVRPEAERSP